MTSRFSRRAALGLAASAAAGVALPIVRTAPAAAQLGASPFGAAPPPPPGLRFGAFAIDTGRVARFGNPDGAALLDHELPRQLHAVFEDLMAARGAGGATLAVRITSVYVPPWAGGRAGGNGAEGPDNIDGVGIVSAGGRVLSQTPVYTTLEPSYSGAWYLPDIDQRRIASLAHQFAYWLRREMGV